MSDTTVKLTGFTITNDGASYGINGQLGSITLTAEQAQRVGERIMSLEQQVADLEAQLAESQRREELLRAVADRVLIGGNHLTSYMLNFGMPSPGNYQKPEDIPSASMRNVWIAWRAIMDFAETLAALDGGAMGEGG